MVQGEKHVFSASEYMPNLDARGTALPIASCVVVISSPAANLEVK